MTGARRPCRTNGCSGTRPVAAIGAAHLWDRCARCAGRILAAAPRTDLGAGLSALDPWRERVAEILAEAERRVAA